MKILYVCADTGICVDKSIGAGSHIRETVETLKTFGHDINVLAADCGLRSVEEISHPLPGKRIVRHRWFSRLMDWRSGGNVTPEAVSVDAGPEDEEQFSIAGSATADSRPDEEIPPGAGGNSVNTGDMRAETEGGLTNLRHKVSQFLYGPFREHLNRLEEKKAYRKRFIDIFRQTLDEFAPDAVYERYALGHHGIASICKKRNIPHVLEVNALLAREAAKQGILSPRESQRVCDREIHFLRNKAQKVLVVSRQLKNEIGEELDHIAVNPNGVDVDMFSPEISPAPVFQRYGLQNELVIGWVGSFGRGRGVEEFLDIAAQIHYRRPDIRFLLIGDGALKDQVHQAVHDLNLEEAVILTGSVPKTDIPAHIAAMDIALAPYPAYGAEYFSPLKVFEYMAMAKPVAATAVGQCIDLLQDDAGLLLPPSKPEIWAEEIVKLLNDRTRCEKMGKRARDRVMNQYTWTRNAERIIEHIETLRAKGCHGKS